MKRNLFTMMIATLASLFALTSCEKEPADLLVGTWNLTTINLSSGGISLDMDPAEMGAQMQFTFTSDGTCYMAMAEDGYEETLTASYFVDVDSKTDVKTLKLTIEGETQSMTINTLESSTLVLVVTEEEDGQLMTVTMNFTRV